METTKVSSKGQVVLPRAVRERKKWQSGTQLLVEETKDGVLLRSAKPFPATNVDEFIKDLEARKYKGKPKTISEMEEAIANGVRDRHARGRY
jgi:AbrB family looped-hinge helix DNA binding protein